MRAIEVQVVLALFVGFGLGTEGASAQSHCHEGIAVADVYGGTNGFVTSSHFGRITYSCSSGWNTYLRGQTLVNGGVVSTINHEGPPAVLGAHILKEANTVACSGAWSTNTFFGVKNFVSIVWRAQDTSPILFASCPPPPPPGPCGGAEALKSSTFTVTGNTRSTLADQQLDFGLSRVEQRPDGTSIMEEWAVISYTREHTSVKLSSSAAFRERVREVVESFRPIGRKTSTVLVVESAAHLHNSRHMPLPTAIPLGNLEAGLPPRAHGQEYWFRAEVGASGTVGRVTVLEASDFLNVRRVQSAIRQNLRLRYSDDRRHPTVIFGLARVGRHGLLTITSQHEVVPMCCCGGKLCN